MSYKILIRVQSEIFKQRFKYLILSGLKLKMFKLLESSLSFTVYVSYFYAKIYLPRVIFKFQNNYVITKKTKTKCIPQECKQTFVLFTQAHVHQKQARQHKYIK